MRTIYLIPCSHKKTKTSELIKAEDLYQGTIFKKAYAYAKDNANKEDIFILSAKYGLVTIGQKIENYDLYLGSMNTEGRKDWARNVLKRLSEVADIARDKFVILAGKKYYEYLISPLGDSVIENYELPLKGMRMGEQSHKLSLLINDTEKTC